MSGAVSPTPTDAGFLAMFPVFNDASRYTGEQRQIWLTTAQANVDAIRWGDNYLLGVYLFTAHHLVLYSGGGTRRSRGRAGRLPLIATAKSIGGASLSYDVTSATIKDGAHWNLTTFGIRWLEMARLVGAGGMQLGYGPVPSSIPWETGGGPSGGING